MPFPSSKFILSELKIICFASYQLNNRTYQNCSSVSKVLANPLEKGKSFADFGNKSVSQDSRVLFLLLDGWEKDFSLNSK